MSGGIASIREDFIKLQPAKRWSFQNSTRKETTAFTHSYHRYPAKFIPQIVQKIIRQYAPKGDETICDPFGGCGTTLVEAKLLGRRSIGFDVNPIAKLITQTKITPIDPENLEKAVIKFRSYFGQQGNDVRLEHHPRISYWFDNDTIGELDKIYFAIKRISNFEIQRFFLCAFSHNLKNSSRWLMKSIKPTVDKSKVIAHPFNSFMNHLDSMVRKNRDFYEQLASSGNIKTKCEMRVKDSTKKWPLVDESIDLIITSPPYVTSYEYADLHQLSLLWFGDDPNQFKRLHRYTREFDQFRKQFIGTSYKEKKQGAFGSNLAEEIVEQLYCKDRRLASDVANYYLDMNKAFKQMYRVLKVGGKAGLIIGNTELKGVAIENAQVAAEQMHNAGFMNQKYIKREITNKLITPWRDAKTGKFTGLENSDKKRVYQYEYVLLMQK